MRYCFSKLLRLRCSSQFQRVFAARCSAADNNLILFILSNGLPHCRLGLSVSKKAGNAAVRNRWKRLIREAFRNTQHELPAGFDFVILPQRNTDIRSVRHLDLSIKILATKAAERTMAKKPTILLTRPKHQAEPVKSKLESLGFSVLLQPAIDILPPNSWQETDDAIQQLRQNQFDWLVFSSSNGVQSFFDRVGNSWNSSSVRIAVVGSGTDTALFQYTGRHADLIPQTFTAEHAAAELLGEARTGKRFLHLRANRGRDVLKRTLIEAGGIVVEIAVYQSIDRKSADPQIVELMQQGKINFVTITSSANAQSLVNMFGELLHKTSLVSISPLTSKTIRDLGFSPQLEANEMSIEGLLNILARPY